MKQKLRKAGLVALLATMPFLASCKPEIEIGKYYINFKECKFGQVGYSSKEDLISNLKHYKVDLVFNTQSLYNDKIEYVFMKLDIAYLNGEFKKVDEIKLRDLIVNSYSVPDFYNIVRNKKTLKSHLTSDLQRLYPNYEIKDVYIIGYLRQ